MQTVRNRTVREVLVWTWRDIAYVTVFAAIPTAAYQLLGWKWLSLPWFPIALIGTAVIFLVSFKNNASYDRAWEARKIWGAIVNSSRAWASAVLGFVGTEGAMRDTSLRLVRRHFAWLTALRFQLREPREWESMTLAENIQSLARYVVLEELHQPLADALRPQLSAEEHQKVLALANKATQVLQLQADALRQLQRDGAIDSFKHVELQSILKDLLDQQGAAERIKNFPYPRQYATLNLFYIRVFTFVVPYGMFREFEATLGSAGVWMVVPVSVLIGWIFSTAEKVGESSENPFEGHPNDIPMTQISRNIEIDMLEMMGEPHQLEPVRAHKGVVM